MRATAITILQFREYGVRRIGDCHSLDALRPSIGNNTLDIDGGRLFQSIKEGATGRHLVECNRTGISTLGHVANKDVANIGFTRRKEQDCILFPNFELARVRLSERRSVTIVGTDGVVDVVDNQSRSVSRSVGGHPLTVKLELNKTRSTPEKCWSTKKPPARK